MNEFDYLFNEFLSHEARTGKSVKLVKMTDEYFEKLKKSKGVGGIIGIPFEINNDQSEDYIFVI